MGNEEKQMEMINDVIEGFVAPTLAAAEIPPVEDLPAEAAPVEVPTTEAPPVAVPPVEALPATAMEGEPPPAVPPIEAPPVVPAVALVVPPVVPVAETPEEAVRKENEALRRELVAMADRLGPKEPPPVTPEERDRLIKEAASQVLTFIQSNETFDEVMKDHVHFNALLTAVVNTAVEKSLRLVPTAVTQIVDSQLLLKTAVNDFYRANNDLLVHRKYVGFVSQEVAAKHPDYTLPKLFEETEKEVRTRLKLAPRTPTPEPGPSEVPISNAASIIPRTVDVNPGFVPSSGGGRTGPGGERLSGEEKQIVDLIS
jgi:hypothetical protein